MLNYILVIASKAQNIYLFSISFQYFGMIESYTFYFLNHENFKLHFWAYFAMKDLLIMKQAK